jgi:hypothetical protein
MIQATASALMNQFANNLKKQLAERPVAPGDTPAATPAPAVPRHSEPLPPPAPAAKPISGFALMAQVLWNSIKRLFGARS